MSRFVSFSYFSLTRALKLYRCADNFLKTIKKFFSCFKKLSKDEKHTLNLTKNFPTYVVFVSFLFFINTCIVTLEDCYTWKCSFHEKTFLSVVKFCLQLLYLATGKISPLTITRKYKATFISPSSKYRMPFETQYWWTKWGKGRINVQLEFFYSPLVI